ncbi:hypothetical protein K491DRAFT_309102 [Lophiostoma macrostomum CBS 122681]|uniref:Uncharacterized protein n=1 Tax=Lophiostoma macrostomum CBS 122681 TaxID=1314788 RepID=A0A6A6SHW2_9PLEO|nr:hypothetical protein K491DRAFT_309102 [Lophiostoma macrostomum CBS 122681]
MSPIAPLEAFTLNILEKRGKVVDKPPDPSALVLEAWAQGYLVGSLIIMAFITMANMRKGVLLHKLILLELIMGIWQGFWLFFNSPIDVWWLSVSAIFLNASWSLHNVIAWMKIKPFLSRPVSLVFIGTVILAQPYWVVEIYANFAYFHGINNIFLKTRPWEALCRDPWWLYTTIMLFWTIKTQYDITLREIIRISPRFGIMLGAMLLSIIFIILDILSVTHVLKSGLPVGINPFWKLAFVFKCLTDSVVLDDFKTALDRLRAFKMSRLGSFSQDTSDRRTRNDGGLVNTWEELEAEAKARKRPAAMPSPDGTLVHASHFPGFSLGRRPKNCKENSIEHKEHKDSVVSPEFIARDFSVFHASTNPEDMVSSAIEDLPMRTMEHSHDNRKNSGWRHLTTHDDDHLANESDYAQALRDVEGHSPPTSPAKSQFSR